MTEDEAKTKWCPFARPVFAGPSRDVAAMNRRGDGTPESAAMCIASACMAWIYNPDAKQVRDMHERLGVGMIDAKKFASHLQEPSFDGYCGLAGKP